MTFRRFLMWIHLALGLTAAVILAIIAVTGAYITFQDPLTRWLNPVPVVPRSSGAVDIQRIVAAVEGQFASKRVATVEVPEGEATVVRLRDRTTVFVNPESATIVAFRPGRFASLENLTTVMRRLHTNLVLGPKGRVIVTAATFEAFLLALTGLLLWWRKKSWRFRPWHGSIFRVSWDLHNATGIWFVAPVLAMVVTGLLLGVPGPVYRYAGVDPSPWVDPPRSAQSPGAAEPVSLARVLSVADSARPQTPTRGVSIPTGPGATYAVRKGRETVFVDRYTGSLIAIQPERAPTAGDDAIETVELLHTGELLGLPGRVIMTLGSLMLAVMTVTGAVLGIKRLMILTGARSGVRDP